MKHMIWSNNVYEISAIAEDLRIDNPDLSEDEAWEEAYDVNSGYLDDERTNLDIDVGTDIIVIADLGLWNGRRMAYREIGSSNLSDCIDPSYGDYIDWYVDDSRDVRIDASHHDGTNRLLFRAWKEGLRDGEKMVFLTLIGHGVMNEADIEKYTRPLGDYVKKVYGWVDDTDRENDKVA